MPGTLRQLFDRDRGSVNHGLTADARLEKRRASNRKSQQKARDHKEALIARLQEENELLKLQVAGSSTAGTSDTSGKTDDGSRSWSLPIITSGSSYTDKSPINSYQHSSPNSTRPLQQPISVNLEACRQAFLAVLASVCDPHLNTIHAVCAKFSESRGASSRYGDLHPPRPVERPLNAGASHLGSTQAHLGHALDIGTAFHGGATAGEAFSDDWTSIFSFPTTYLPPSAFIPSRGEEGLLSVPGLEPAHPVIDLELAAGDVWAEVICMVDISRTDIEDLASRLTTKIRCYGFGPVLMRQDVVQVCQAFPLFTPTGA